MLILQRDVIVYSNRLHVQGVVMGASTISQVAKQAGVSVATVSRVINQSGTVTPETAKKVMDAIRQLGASPASTAYVGDSQTDIQTAQNAGVYGVGVSWGFRPRQVLEAQGADVICDDAQQLAMALSR